MKLKQQLKVSLEDLQIEIQYILDKVKSANMQSARLIELQTYINAIEAIKNNETEDGFFNKVDEDYLNELFAKETFIGWAGEIVKRLNRRPVQLTLFSQELDSVSKIPAKNKDGLPLPDLYYRMAEIYKYRDNQAQYKHYIELAYANYHNFDNWYIYKNLVVGICLKNGWLTNQDTEAAVVSFKKSCTNLWELRTATDELLDLYKQNIEFYGEKSIDEVLYLKSLSNDGNFEYTLGLHLLEQANKQAKLSLIDQAYLCFMASTLKSEKDTEHARYQIAKIDYDRGNYDLVIHTCLMAYQDPRLQHLHYMALKNSDNQQDKTNMDSLLLQAKTANYAPALYEFAIHPKYFYDMAERETAINLAADKNYPPALCWLGKRAIKKGDDYSVIHNYLSRALTEGSVEAGFLLAKLYLDELDVIDMTQINVILDLALKNGTDIVKKTINQTLLQETYYYLGEIYCLKSKYNQDVDQANLKLANHYFTLAVNIKNAVKNTALKESFSIDIEKSALAKLDITNDLLVEFDPDSDSMPFADEVVEERVSKKPKTDDTDEKDSVLKSLGKLEI